MSKFEVTQEYLVDNYDYSVDGFLVRKFATSGVGNCVGRIIGDYGSKNLGRRERRYISTKIKGRGYRLHRLIFLFHHGYLPKQIDHINRDCLDNRIENLREVTPSQSAINRGIFSNNKSGYTGVIWDRIHLKWTSYININNKRTTLGYYNNKEDAIASARGARINHHSILSDIEDRYLI